HRQLELAQALHEVARDAGRAAAVPEKDVPALLESLLPVAEDLAHVVAPEPFRVRLRWDREDLEPVGDEDPTALDAFLGQGKDREVVGASEGTFVMAILRRQEDRALVLHECPPGHSDQDHPHTAAHDLLDIFRVPHAPGPEVAAAGHIEELRLIPRLPDSLDDPVLEPPPPVIQPLVPRAADKYTALHERGSPSPSSRPRWSIQAHRPASERFPSSAGEQATGRPVSRRPSNPAHAGTL